MLQPLGAVPTAPLSKPSLNNTPPPLGAEELLEDGLMLEATDELATEERIELDATELGADELTTEDRMELEATEERIELEATEERMELEATDKLAAEEDTVAPQAAPVTWGTSTVVPPLLP